MSSPPAINPPQKADGRRDAGERTRRRILEATRELLAERSEDAIRLRDITDAAQVNVAAVNYHFGCLKALCTAAIKEAIETIIHESIEQLSELSDDATLEEIAAAWIRPVIAARSGPTCNEKRAFMRITARASSHPPEELCEWMSAAIARFHDELVNRLRHALPGLPEVELRFRVACAAGILQVLRTDGMQDELADKPARELEQLLTPVISGALGGVRTPGQPASAASTASAS